MQINIKVSYKLISTLWVSRFPTRWYNHYWWAWSNILKVLKVTSLQYLYNISKKKLGMEFIFCMNISNQKIDILVGFVVNNMMKKLSSTFSQTVEQIEVVKEVALSQVSKLNWTITKEIKHSFLQKKNSRKNAITIIDS